MAKVSSTVCGLACSAPRIHLCTATSRLVGVGCGCHRDLVMAAEASPRSCQVLEPLARAPVSRVG